MCTINVIAARGSFYKNLTYESFITWWSFCHSSSLKKTKSLWLLSNTAVALDICNVISQSEYTHHHGTSRINHGDGLNDILLPRAFGCVNKRETYIPWYNL